MVISASQARQITSQFDDTADTLKHISARIEAAATKGSNFIEVLPFSDKVLKTLQDSGYTITTTSAFLYKISW